MTEALWLPGWYNLDQTIAVGAADDWLFWNDRDAMFENAFPVPDVPSADLYFFNDVSSESRCHRWHATIQRIAHPTIGDLQRVDTTRFGVYDYVTPDGKVYKVEAEQDPGYCYSPDVKTDAWHVLVTLNSVSAPALE
jgi:hypothetical protein